MKFAVKFQCTFPVSNIFLHMLIPHLSSPFGLFILKYWVSSIFMNLLIMRLSFTSLPSFVPHRYEYVHPAMYSSIIWLLQCTQHSSHNKIFYCKLNAYFNCCHWWKSCFKQVCCVNGWLWELHICFWYKSKYKDEFQP